MLGAIYFPEPVENKPEWFNGFIHLEKHPKEKYGWNKYIYLPNYYSGNSSGEVSAETRFGRLVPSKNKIDTFFKDYFARTKTKVFGSGSKHEMGGKAIGTTTVLNAATGKEETHRYFWANNEYVIRQLTHYDKHQIVDILQDATKSIEIFLGMTQFSVYLDEGLSIAPINNKGELKGLQTFSIFNERITAEPLTYIDLTARGQGIFSIYHEMSVELGLAVGVGYVYAQCEADSKMRKVYESYGYIKQRSKWIGKREPREVYVFHYPLKTTQQAFF